MKLPFSIDHSYTTYLTKTQIKEELENLAPSKTFGGLRKDNFVSTVSEEDFIIWRETIGVDFFTLERYPVIRGSYVASNPLTINILIKPGYFTILFFAVFVFLFIPAAVFVDKMTVSGVYRVPTISERFMFSLGGILPGLWCYFGYIRPIKKAQKWIVEKLNLVPINNQAATESM